MNAKRQWHKLLEKQKAIMNWAQNCNYHFENSAVPAPTDLDKLEIPINNQTHNNNNNNNNNKTLNLEGLGVITTGIAVNYFDEVKSELSRQIPHFHIGAYPWPEKKIQEFTQKFKTLLVIEEGYPFFEESLRGILPTKGLRILGKLTGELPREGELTPDFIRKALGLQVAMGIAPVPENLVGRPPQLCAGCPHTDSYTSLKMALEGFGSKTLVTSDVGCYTLGALAPIGVIETCVCMGASIGLAKGAADAGFFPAIAVIGDGTFLHSGITPLLDAVSSNSNMTLLILDNHATAMTGGQPPQFALSRLKEIVLACGVSSEHVHQLEAHRKFDEENAKIIRREIDYAGLSVIITVRECIETLKRKKLDSKGDSH